MTIPTTNEDAGHDTETPDARVIEARVRGWALELDPGEIGTEAALELAEHIETYSMILFGCEPSDVLTGDPEPLRQGDEVAEDRDRAAARTMFAEEVAHLCRFAQHGELPDAWGAPGLEMRGLDRAKFVLHLLGVFFHPRYLPSGREPWDVQSNWWSDPGPIDLERWAWRFLAVIHLARARILEREGRPAPPLPVYVREGTREGAPR